MAKKYLDYDGLLYFWQKIKAYFVSDIAYDSTNNKLTKTKNGSSSDVVGLVGTNGTSGFVKNGSTVTSSSGYTASPIIAGIPYFKNTTYTPASASPKMDGTAAVGTSAKYAREDHVHPSDTSRVPTTTTVNGHALSDNITLDASDVGALPDSTVIPSKTSDLTNDSDFVSDADYVHTDSNYTSAEKTKLAGIAAGAEVNVQSDWSATSGDAFIKNKPTIPTLQNVFGIVKVGTTSIEADTTRDTLNLSAGVGITLTPDATNDTVTIAETTPNVISSVTDGGNYLEFMAYGNPYQAVAVGAKGAANGVCPLNASSKIDSTYLPSYVDDVIEAYPRSGATELSSTWLSTTSGGSALTPETGKIYVLMADSTSYATNTQFRWGGSAYVKLADGGVSSITNAEIDTIVAA